MAADHDLDTAAIIATLGAILGIGVENLEPIAVRRGLIGPASSPPRLATLYVFASQCWTAGRVEAVSTLPTARWSSAVDATKSCSIPRACSATPQRTVEWCRAHSARGNDTHTFTRNTLVFRTGVRRFRRGGESHRRGLDRSRRGHRLLCGRIGRLRVPRRRPPQRGGSPPPGTAARSLKTAATAPWGPCWRPAVLVGGQVRRPDGCVHYATVAIRSYHESGNTAMIGIPLVVLAALFDRLRTAIKGGHHCRIAFNPLTAAAISEINTAMRAE